MNLTRKLLPAFVCLTVILSSVGTLAGGINPSEETPEFNSLGGLWNPDGPTESGTTHIVQPATLLSAHPGPLPSAVDNSAGLPPVGNQQSQGSCTCWAIGYYHATYIENRESAFDLADPANQVSPAFLYNVANGGYNGGSYMEDVADLIISNGACSMAEMPYDTYDYNSWPSEDWIWVSGMKRRATSQNWLYIGGISGQAAMKAYLAQGNTATTGIDVWSNFDYIHNFNYTYSSSERYGTNRGGHIVTICGYDDEKSTADGKGAFRMVNSWGIGWGQAGYWWMSYAAAMDSLICYGWAMYLDSLVDYKPEMAVKIQIDHAERGDIVSNQGIGLSVSEGGPALQSKSFLGCFYIEDWYGADSQQIPFPDGKMAFDISEFLTSMNRGLDHQFSLSLANGGDMGGELLGMEILNAEWWEGDISWDTPLEMPAYSMVETEAWVEPDLFLHKPLRIDSDIDLARMAIGEFWNGNGTESNPYLIHDYYIWGENWGNCIYIGNTTSCLIIEGCIVEGASGGESSDYHLDAGIFFYSVTSGAARGNAAAGNLIGYCAVSSEDIIMENNTAKFNSYGMIISDCCDSLLHSNSISANELGLDIDTSTGISAYHNSIIDNTVQAYDDTGLNFWDDGYPSGGNYWSDYNGTDAFYGPGQNIPGGDGVGDIPYTALDGSTGAQDRYPLMEVGTIPNPPTFGRSLAAGWNFVSMPADLGSLGTEVEVALSSINGSWDSVKYYDSFDTSDPWKSHRPGSQLNDLATITQTMGFWVHAAENCTLLTYETMPEFTSISLKAGWNMVGYPTLTERTISDALWGTGADRVETFDPSDPELLRVMGPGEMMVAGQGYWVHVVTDTVWTVDW